MFCKREGTQDRGKQYYALGEELKRGRDETEILVGIKPEINRA